MEAWIFGETKDNFIFSARHNQFFNCKTGHLVTVIQRAGVIGTRGYHLPYKSRSQISYRNVTEPTQLYAIDVVLAEFQECFGEALDDHTGAKLTIHIPNQDLVDVINHSWDE